MLPDDTVSTLAASCVRGKIAEVQLKLFNRKQSHPKWGVNTSPNASPWFDFNDRPSDFKYWSVDSKIHFNIWSLLTLYFTANVNLRAWLEAIQHPENSGQLYRHHNRQVPFDSFSIKLCHGMSRWKASGPSVKTNISGLLSQDDGMGKERTDFIFLRHLLATHL